MDKIVRKEIDLNGRKLILETGKIANLTNSAVWAQLGDTVVLCTLSSKPMAEDIGYFPLSIEYVEKYYASGKITPQKFIKREGRPADEAILAGRAIDRSIRPFFPKDFHHEVQLVLNVLSYDGINDPVTLAFIGASAAISISSVPWEGPLGVTRLAKLEGKEIINPTLEETEKAELDLMVASSKDKIAMIEARGNEIPDNEIFAGIKAAHEASQEIINLIEEFKKEAGKEKQTFTTVSDELDEKILHDIKDEIKEKISAGFADQSKKWSEGTADEIKAEVSLAHKDEANSTQISAIFDKVAKELMTDLVLNQGKRVDGRKMEEVRAITIETGLLPRAHGSALFSRGSTQALAITTIGPLSLSQTLEGMVGEKKKRFMQHYNMGINPFSTGEPKRIGSPSRRDIGHGALVEKSLIGVLPSEADFPYAIRTVSEIMAANASTSMASLCASALSLRDAGVTLKNMVAGIALGLLSDDKKFQVITDMQALEDFYGQMDFKVTGSKKGVTGIQMDTKLQGLTFEVIEEALRQGKAARESIIEIMENSQPAVNKISEYAPKVQTTHINPDQIGMLIGPGGKNINALIERTGAQIDIEDDGSVMVSSTSQESIDKAITEIESMFKEIKVGEIYDGTVVRLAPFGAFVEIVPGKDGLVHISQMAPGRVERAEDIVSEGQTVKVRVTDVSPEGKVGLSMLFGNDIKPESEGRPSFGGRSSFGGPRRDFGDRDPRPRRR